MMVMMASKQGGASSEIINQYLKAQADSMLILSINVGT